MKSAGGVLLTGPAGCGKKSLVQLVADECNAVLVNVDSSVHGARPGDSERQLCDAFSRARDVCSSEPCVLLLNELDSICSSRRNSSRGEFGDSLSARMLAELVSLMDDHYECQDRFLIVATTDKPTNVDPCLRRFGRFDCEVIYLTWLSFCLNII